MVVDMRVFHNFNMSEHIENIWVGGRRDRGQQGKPGGEDQGGR